MTKRATVLQDGASQARNISLYFGLLPQGLTTKVESIKLSGSSATVTYEFFNSGRLISARPAIGTAVKVAGKWLVGASTWAALVAQSNIHGSG